MNFNITWYMNAGQTSPVFRILLKPNNYSKVLDNPAKYECELIDKSLYFRGIKIIM